MAAAPIRPCASQPCPEFAGPSGRCSKHETAKGRERGTTKERGYGSDWEKVRAAKIVTDPICEIRSHCQGMVATEVDHKLPVRVRPDLRLVWSNLQSTCHTCHAFKTAADQVLPSAAAVSPVGGSEFSF